MKPLLVSWVPLFLLLATACGGGDEEKITYSWECYDRTDFGRCECYEVASNSKADLGQSTAVPVDTCAGYELCKSYYDTLREEGRCDCGDADFEPGASQRRGTVTVDACPED